MSSTPTASSERYRPRASNESVPQGDVDNSTIIVMLARQRSGTNALRYILDSHTEVACFPELFLPEPSPRDRLAPKVSYFNFLERQTKYRIGEVLTSREVQDQVFVDYLTYLRGLSDKRFILVDVKYSSTHHFDGPWRSLSAEPALFSLIRQHKLRVLNLRRRNYLRYYVSERKAQETNRWHARAQAPRRREPWYRGLRLGRATNDATPDTTITLSIDHLMRTLELCRRDDGVVDRSFGRYGRWLTVEYEDLFPRLDGAPDTAQLERVANWLGVAMPSSLREPVFKKQALLPLRQTITNYGEVEEALRGTEFEYCLEDERMYRSGGSRARST